MLTKFVHLSQVSMLAQKLHRRQLFGLLLGSLPLLGATTQQQPSEPIKNKSYGKGTYGG